MLGFNSIISRYLLLKRVGAIWLLSISQIGFATTINQVIAVRVWSSSTHTRITIESSNILKYMQFSLGNPERVVVDIKDINLNLSLREISSKIRSDDPYIKSARIKQFDQKTVRIVLELKQSVNPRLFTLSPMDGFKERLVIDLYPIKITDDVQDLFLLLLQDCNRKNSLNKQVLLSKENIISKTQRNRPIVIMLDPGHGGKDSGAIGKYCTREKDVVLQIARYLKMLIEQESNMRAYMTRNEDVFIPLKIRVEKAKKQHADLFISIHADAFISRYPSGSSVFALSAKGASSTAAQYLADTQNTSDFINGINKSGDHYVDRTIFDMVQSLTVIDSIKFGKAVLRKIGSVNKLHSNNVEQAGFTVLKAPEIPSILIETAFISNIEEEHKLKTKKFHQEIAKSILKGIKTYLLEKNSLMRDS